MCDRQFSKAKKAQNPISHGWLGSSSWQQATSSILWRGTCLSQSQMQWSGGGSRRQDKSAPCAIMTKRSKDSQVLSQSLMTPPKNAKFSNPMTLPASANVNARGRVMQGVQEEV